MIVLRMLESHYDILLEKHADFAQYAETVEPYAPDGIRFMDIIFDADCWGSITEEEVIRNAKFPYDLYWSDVEAKTAKDGEAFVRVDAHNQLSQKMFKEGDREMVPLDDIIQAYSHHSIRQLIEEMSEKFYVMSWSEQINILKALGAPL